MLADYESIKLDRTQFYINYHRKLRKSCPLEARLTNQQINEERQRTKTIVLSDEEPHGQMCKRECLS